MHANILIWDGVEFNLVTREEADKLASEDKAQILSDGLVDGLSLKYRNQFTGYKTREMRAEANPAPAPEPAPKPEPKPEPEPAPEPEQDTSKLHDMTVKELRQLAADNDLEGYTALKKADLIAFIEENL